MNPRKTLTVGALVAALGLVASQVYSNGVCTYSITGGSVSITSPSRGACFVQYSQFTPSAHYTLNWQVTGTSSGTTPCDAAVGWSQSGGTSDSLVVCGVTNNSTDWILNANIGTTGSFSRTMSWSCSTDDLGNWSLNASTSKGGVGYATTSIPYSVKTSCP